MNKPSIARIVDPTARDVQNAHRAGYARGSKEGFHRGWDACLDAIETQVFASFPNQSAPGFPNKRRGR